MKVSIFKQLMLVVIVGIASLQLQGATITHTVIFTDYNMSTTHDTINNQGYVTYSFRDGGYYGDVGCPMIPCVYLRFSVPYHATNILVTGTTSGHVLNTTISEKIMPVQPSYISNDTTEHSFQPTDTGQFTSTAIYPTQSAWLIDDGEYHGKYRVITVGVAPLRYTYSANRITLNNVKVTVSYTQNNTLPAQSNQLSLSTSGNYFTSIARVNSAELDAKECQQVKDLVVNPNNVEAYAKVTQSQGFVIDIDYDPGAYEYCVLTNRDLAPSFKKLVALKRQKGLKAGVVCVEDLYNNPYFSGGDYVSGLSDNAGIVRQYLRYAHMAGGTQYLLIGGKESVNVPVRYITTMRDSKHIYNTPSDLYFSDLDMDWSENINTSTKWQFFNYSPEIYVGRLLCETSEHIYNYTDKLLRYELNPGNGDYSYLTKIFYQQQSSMKTWKESQYVHEVAKSIYNDSTLFDKEYLATGAEVIGKLNNNYGFISFHSHGCPVGINIGSKDYKSTRITAIQGVNLCPNPDRHLIEQGNGINNLTNKYYPNILYTIACTTMPYDIYTDIQDSNFTYNTEYNFGESFTLGKDYGGISYIGNTREGISSSDNTQASVYLERKFFESILNGNYKIGQSASKSKVLCKYSNLPSEHHIKLTQNILGDPEVEMWTDIPQTITDYTITRNSNDIQVSGNLPDSCIIAYCDNAGHAGQVLYSGTGSINLTNISPNSCIMLYKHNYLPTIAPVEMQNETLSKSQFVFASEYKIGRNVDNNRTTGNVIIENGVEYEIEATGDVLIDAGTIVKNGGTLRVWTPGTVTIGGGEIKNGANVEIYAGKLKVLGAFNAELGSSVKINNYSPLR